MPNSQGACIFSYPSIEHAQKNIRKIQEGAERGEGSGEAVLTEGDCGDSRAEDGLVKSRLDEEAVGEGGGHDILHTAVPLVGEGCEADGPPGCKDEHSLQVELPGRGAVLGQVLANDVACSHASGAGYNDRGGISNAIQGRSRSVGEGAGVGYRRSSQREVSVEAKNRER